MIQGYCFWFSFWVKGSNLDFFVCCWNLIVRFIITIIHLSTPEFYAHKPNYYTYIVLHCVKMGALPYCCYPPLVLGVHQSESHFPVLYNTSQILIKSIRFFEDIGSVDSGKQIYSLLIHSRR
ncbi:hypothetical protein VNO77_35415 [Canavalia gladiata]|uniref:Uncharacterized protein n=1 Tax=Canavalia gladiata TaxID=3824 RepID=A0AAN9KHR4_CANGL